MPDAVALDWLDDPPPAETGVRWGVPWPRGACDRDQSFALVADDAEISVQTWPTAFWPDGSVKWTGHAAVLGPDAPTDPDLVPVADDPEAGLSVDTDDAGAVTVETGTLTATLGGDAVVDHIATDEGTVARNGRLVCRREERTEDDGATVRREEPFESVVDDVTVERSGPIRAVVAVEGRHAAVAGDRSWLPFTVRFAFYAGSPAVRVTHTVTYDGDPETDFVGGLGLAFDVPLSGPAHHRHVRFAGDEGLFREPARLLPPKTDDEVYERHLAGDPVHAPESISGMTPWDDFELVQDSADHYRIRKRVSEDHAWVDAAHGRRAAGLGFAGDADGGLSVAMRNCWETYPSSLAVSGLTDDAATLTAWFWSPAAEAMDLRLYDDEREDASGPAYGGVSEGTSTAVGIAKTSECTLSVADGVPGADALWDRAADARDPAMLVPTPEYLHDVNAFGRWSLPDRSDPDRAWLEDQLTAAVEFYRDEVEQRRWYGFWDYGDVMHSYDESRHQWRYDTGGYAWQNTEQVPTMWLWYTFLRTGRADVFRLAEAMTRHTSEVDVYHEGPMQGLGTRHNVQHWGGGCVEPRTATTAHHRVYYYLTGGDERLGAVFEEVRDADYATLDVDPMRNHTDPDDHPTHARAAPDWLSYSANWFTRWERFEDESYRDKLLTGIEDLADMPYRLLSGSNFGYDPATGELHHIGENTYGFAFLHCMGGPQFWPELLDSLPEGTRETFAEMLADVGRAYLDPEARAEIAPEVAERNFEKLPMYATNLAAFAAERRDDPALAARAWDLLLHDEDERKVPLPMARETADEYVRPVEELPGVKTNTVCIWSLNVVAALDYVGDHLPETPRE
ncbi:MAG: hypothetical protein ABEJ68_04875 [Halobacteriaceae archaeon]